MQIFRAICLLLYAVLSILYISITDLTDEPDFDTRVARITNGDVAWLNPLSILPVENFKSVVVCSNQSQDRDDHLYSRALCGEDVVNVYKIKAHIIIINFLFLALFLPFKVVRIKEYRIHRKFQKLDHLNIIFLSAINPVVIYNLQFASSESFMTLVSLFAIWIFSSTHIIIGLLYLVAITILDQGQGYIMTIYYLYFLIISMCDRKGGYYNHGASAILILALIVTYFHGFTLLNLIYEITSNLKVREILDSLKAVGSDYFNVGTLWLRPFYTLASMIYLTAKKWFPYSYYVQIIICAIFYLVLNSLWSKSRNSEVKWQRWRFLKMDGSISKVALSDTLKYVVIFICITVFILPTYAYGKYFIFLTPILLGCVLQYIAFRSLFMILISANFSILAERIFTSL